MPAPAIVAIFTKPFGVRDFEAGPGQYVQIPAGIYTLEEIPNPNPKLEAPWWVIKGTKQGAAVEWWRQWEGNPIAIKETAANA